MAGSLKPAEAGAEGEIVFGDYNLSFPNRGRPALLCDGIINQTLNKDENSGILMDTYYTKEYLTFSLPNRSTIWAIGRDYHDVGGISNKPINLFKKEDNEWINIGVYQVNPKFDKWYKLFENLAPGDYKITPTGRYSSFAEWYVESTRRWLYLSGDVMYVKQ